MRRFVCTQVLLCSLLSASATAQSSITGERVDCENGMAAGHPCHAVDLLSRLMPDRLEADFVLDMWGWKDPATGHEYALVTTNNAVAFVDISDPINPQYLGRMLSHDGAQSGWRDVKVYQNHLFAVVDGNGANGLQVFDLTLLRSSPSTPQIFNQSAHYALFGQAHNLAINTETGYAYVAGSNTGPCPYGLHIVDIRAPLQPAYAGCFIDSATGNAGDGYTHDAQCVVYDGPDAKHAGKEICFGANVSGISIADVSDKTDPQKLASATYPSAAYAHQAWLTENHRYLFLNDEIDELQPHWLSLPPLPGTRTLIWDVEDLDDPVFLQEYFGPTGASDHNLYIHRDTLYMANYAGGLRIVNISDPTAPVEVAHFDTYPYSDHVGLNGAWTAYPYFDSGTIAITSGFHGLFLVRHNPGGFTDREHISGLISSALTLSAAHPNPFNSVATLTLHTPVPQLISIEVHDVLGRKVSELYKGPLGAGDHVFHLDGHSLRSGTYLIVATAKEFRVTQSATLMK